MIPRSLISDLSTLRPEKSAEENLLNARLCYRFLADNARELQLNDGRFIGDVTEFQEVLRQIANAARKAQNSIAPAPIVDSDAAGSRSLTVESGESGRPSQPHATCPNCPHAAHAGSRCLAFSDGARCLCEFKPVSPHPDSSISEGGAVRAGAGGYKVR
jgi:hypothetical protein